MGRDKGTAGLALVAALLLGAASLAGCSSDSSTTSPSTSASATASPSGTSTSALCTDVDAVQASFQDLRSLDVIAQGTSAVKSQFATFKTALDQMLTSARGEFATESAAVQTAVDELQTAVSNLADSPSLADAKAVKDGISSVGTSLDALTTSIKGAC